LFTQRVKKFIRALRRDCRDATLPVVMVQIGRVVGTLAGQREWNRIQNAQRLLPSVIERLAIVPAIDLRMSDFIHISGDEQYRLGVRMAQAMAALKGVARRRPGAHRTQEYPVADRRGVHERRHRRGIRQCRGQVAFAGPADGLCGGQRAGGRRMYIRHATGGRQGRPQDVHVT
jgi:hypothetical protein